MEGEACDGGDALAKEAVMVPNHVFVLALGVENLDVLILGATVGQTTNGSQVHVTATIESR